MTDDVYSVLKNRSGNSGSRFAFPSPDYPDIPISRVHKAHDGAVSRADIKPRFILYDLRHTYASRAVMAGVDLPTLAALLGHTSIQMTMRYVHPAKEHKKEATGKLEIYKAAEDLRLAKKNHPVSTMCTTMARIGGREGIRTPDPLLANWWRAISDGVRRFASALILRSNTGDSLPCSTITFCDGF